MNDNKSLCDTCKYMFTCEHSDVGISFANHSVCYGYAQIKNEDEKGEEEEKTPEAFWESMMDDDLPKLKARREQGIEPQLYIKDIQMGTIRPYGSNQHDALYLSLDGRTLSYENLQNGDGSRYGDYRLCDNPEGILPEDMDMPEAVYTYICIGGGYLGGA